MPVKAQRRNMCRGTLTRYCNRRDGASAISAGRTRPGDEAGRAHGALTSWKKAEAKNTPVLATHLLLPRRSMGL